MNTKRTCAVVQLPSAKSAPRTPAEVVDFAPGVDWNVLAIHIDHPQLDELLVAWALRSIIGAEETIVPWLDLAALTGFEPRRLVRALFELRRVEAIAMTSDDRGKWVRSLVTPGALTSAYLRHALEKGGPS